MTDRSPRDHQFPSAFVSPGVERTMWSRSLFMTFLFSVLVLLMVPLLWPLAGLLTDREWLTELPAQSPRILKLLATSLSAAAAVAILSSLLGIPLAVYAWRGNGRVAKFLRGALLIGCFLPLVLVAGGWDGVFGANGYLRCSFWSQGGWPAFFWMTCIHAAFAVPLVALIVGRSLQSNLCAAEEDLLGCASLSDVIRFGSLAAVRPALLLSALLAAAPVLTDMTISDLFKLRTFPEEVFTEFEAFHSAPLTTAVASLLAATIAGMASGRLSRLGSIFSSSRSARSTDDLPAFSVWTAIAFPGCIVLAIAGFGTFWQLGLVGDDTGGMVWNRHTAGVSLIREFQREGWLIPHNLGWAAAASALATFAGFTIAWFWLAKARIRRLTMWLMLWSLLTPGPVLAVAMLQFWNLDDGVGLLAFAYRTPLVLCIGWAVRTLPLAWLLCSIGLDSISPNLEAAVMEGATGHRLFAFASRAAWPWLLLSCACGTAAAFAELPLAHLLSTPGFDPLGVRMFGLLHTSTANQPAALAIVMMATVACLTWLIRSLGRRAVRRAAT